MSHADFMRTMTGLTCGMQSLVGYIDQRQNGVPANIASVNFAGNIFNGLARNEIAYQMQRYGNPMGNLINMYAGYGNPVSNTIGTLGLMSACSPWLFFNSPCCYSGFGFGYSVGIMPHYGMGWGMGGFWC